MAAPWLAEGSGCWLLPCWLRGLAAMLGSLWSLYVVFLVDLLTYLVGKLFNFKCNRGHSISVKE